MNYGVNFRYFKYKKCFYALSFGFLGIFFSQASAQEMSPDENFQARCEAEGVVLCASFDSESAGDMPGRQGNAAVDTDIKASGAGSMFVDVCGSCPSAPGYISPKMGADFAENSSLYIQWRQRFDQNMIDEDLGGEGYKQMVLYDQSPGGNIEVAMLNLDYNGFPQLYTAMGGAYMRRPQRSKQGTDLMWNETETICTTSDMDNCLHYKPDEWMTFYYEQEIGDWGQANTRIKVSMSGENEPLQTFITYDDWTFESDGASGAQRTIWLGPFSLGRSGSGFLDAKTWIDELIISTEPIADPYVEETIKAAGYQSKNQDGFNVRNHPFRQNTYSISFSGEKPIRASVYDIRGNEVVMFNELGSGKIEWDASGLKKGVYFLKAKDGNRSYNHKVAIY